MNCMCVIISYKSPNLSKPWIIIFRIYYTLRDFYFNTFPILDEAICILLCNNTLGNIYLYIGLSLNSVDTKSMLFSNC